MAFGRSVVAVLLVMGVSALPHGMSVRSSGPDFGGQIPAVSTRGSTPGATVVAVSPGQVLSSTGQGLSGILLIATDAQGHTVGATYSGADGVFELVTPPEGPLILTVYGTEAVVPFEPSSPILVVLP